MYSLNPFPQLVENCLSSILHGMFWSACWELYTSVSDQLGNIFMSFYLFLIFVLDVGAWSWLNFSLVFAIRAVAIKVNTSIWVPGRSSDRLQQYHWGWNDASKDQANDMIVFKKIVLKYHKWIFSTNPSQSGLVKTVIIGDYKSKSKNKRTTR